MSATGPSSSPASSSYNTSELCITSLEDIRAQLLDRDEEVRFRCLAFDKRCSPRTRCFGSSKTFERDHPRLHKNAVDALNIKPQNITVEEFRPVVRILFCNKHHGEKLFRLIFDLIEPKWISSGIAKKIELLEAIRHRHNPIQRPVVEETVETSIPASPPATPPPKKATRSANRPQSFLQTPEEPEDYAHSHYTRSKSNSGNQAYRQEEPNKHQSIGSDFTQEMAFVPSNSSRFESTSPVLGPSFELPLRGSRQLRSSNGLVMSPKNTSNKSGSPESPSQSTLISGSGSLSRQPAVSHKQPKPVSEPLIPTSGVFTKATNAPGKLLLSPAPDGNSQKMPDERGQQLTPASEPKIPKNTPPTNPAQSPWQALSSEYKLGLKCPIDEEEQHLRPSETFLPSELADDTISIRTTLTAEATTTASRCSRPSTAQSHSTPKSASRVSSSSVDWDGDRSSIGHPLSTKENGLSLDEISKQYGGIAAASSPPTNHSTEHTNLMQAQNPVAKEIRDPVSTRRASVRKVFRGLRKSRGQVTTYILRDPEYFDSYKPPLPPLVKLVISGSMEDEKRKLEKECCHMTNISYIVDGQEMAFDNYEKVEKIVHAALQNFHRDFKCQRCQEVKDDVDWNRDWFDLPDDVVLETVRLWRRFALQDPWDRHGNLKDYWRKVLEHEEMALLKIEERLDDAKYQNERWGKWLDLAIEGSSEKMRPPPR